MKKPSDSSWEELRQSIIGLGEKSIRKSYYPELQRRIAELEQSNKELQEEISERIRAQEAAKKLAQQLQQSQKMEAIGRLAGGIAHDFNNILSAIIGYTELAQFHMANSCKEPNCPASRDLEMVLQAADRVRDMVQQILTFSRHQDDTKIPIVLADEVKDALSLLRSSLPQSIEIRTKLNTGSAKIMANATQIHQIIMNLGTNAYHAMIETGGILAVELDKVEIHPFDEKATNLKLTPGQYLLLKICDTGCGMSRALLDKIFDPYFTTKPMGKGTGMGLAVVHGIVKNHDGLITVYSEPDKGTSFQVYLPQHTQGKIPEGEQIKEEITGGSERILLVDDETLVAEMMQRQLENLGYQVKSYNKPEEALTTFYTAPEKFDIIMTDMTMPKMNGVAFAQEILRVREDIPVILCTGFSELVNEEKARAVGIKAFVMKPLVRKTIADTVRRVLDE